MKKKYLTKKIEVKRPMLFLCGPYFNNTNKYDRRTILSKFLKKDDDKKNAIPLIIDDFLTEKNIVDKSINIQLLEELFASISVRTYIFLDTISTASELGLFANHSTKNSIHVFLPYTADVVKNKVGYFVENIILKQNKDNISVDYYRPKIAKKAIATNFIEEHYEFIDGCIPSEIKDKIKKDCISNVLYSEILIKESDEIPEKLGIINYTIKGEKLIVKISVKTLFYIVAGIIYDKYGTALKKKNNKEVSDEEIKEIHKELKEIIKRAIIMNHLYFSDYLDIEIGTYIKADIDKIIKHICIFIYLYHKANSRYKYHFVTLKKDKFLEKMDKESESPFTFEKIENDLINEINYNENKYYEEFKIFKRGKKRLMYRYKNEKIGEDVKKIHKKIGRIIEDRFEFSKSSFAYQKKKSVKKCALKHIEGRCFMKVDIKEFFNSIDFEILIKLVLKYCNIHEVYGEQVYNILKLCTVNNKIQLGFNISPLLSEIYMKSFDNSLEKYSYERSLVYTRYADDILISSKCRLSNNELRNLKDKIRRDLKKLGLKINDKKFKVSNLNKQGEHFKYLGINIVYKNKKNIISVGKKYKYAVAKEFLKFISSDQKNDEHISYQKKRIIGKIEYVRQIEGLIGYMNVTDRISASTKRKIDIGKDKINFNDFIKST